MSFNNLEEIIESLTPDELLGKMAEISSAYQTDRATLGTMAKAYFKKRRKTRLYIAFKEFDKLKNKECLEYVKKIKEVKLLADDIIALVELECEAELHAYKDARHNCETSKEAFDMFAKQLSWHQTNLNFSKAELYTLGLQK